MLLKVKVSASVLLIAAALALLGLVTGLGLAYLLYSNRTAQAEATVGSLLLINQQQAQRITEISTDQALSLERAPGTTALASLDKPVLLAATDTTGTTGSAINAAKGEAPNTAKAAKTPPEKPKAMKAAVPAPAAVPRPRDALASTPAAPAMPATQSTTAPADKPALDITMEQAGISGIDTSSVRFKSGRQVNVGGDFPSGEKLISVNPADGRIVTDRRTIVLARPQTEK